MIQAELSRVQAFLDRSDLPGALQYLSSRNLEAPGRSSVLYHIGYIHRLMNNFVEAVRFYKKALELDPTVPPFHLGLGIALQQQGDFDSAIGALKRAIELDPQYASAWNSLGLTHKMSGNYIAALKAYRRAQEVVVAAASDWAKTARPETMQVRLNDAGQKGLVTAPEYFSAIRLRLRADLMYAMVMNNIGCCYAELGQTSDARNAFIESIQFIPDGARYEPPFLGLRSLE
jgi:tetratricopeptide (TPR) repeat protein